MSFIRSFLQKIGLGIFISLLLGSSLAFAVTITGTVVGSDGTTPIVGANALPQTPVGDSKGAKPFWPPEAENHRPFSAWAPTSKRDG